MTHRWLLLAIAACAPAYAADLTGDWVATVTGQGEPRYFRVSLNSNLTGEWGKSKLEATQTGSKLDIKLEGNPAGSLTATLTGDNITGTGTITGTGRNNAPAPVTFSLKRPIAPRAQPRTLSFEPKDYYATYSAAAKPVLTIFPGDTVHTATADAYGVDSKGIQHRGGDSNIGPFYIEGALPGDTLVVHLLKIQPNRTTARQGTRVNAHAVTAQYLVNAKYDPAVTGEWTILPDKGIAVPTHPSEHMKRYSIPLKPMLGCISVAPAGDEQFRGGDLGPFGGNLDYNDNVAGTTLYFPVFHPGALLGMGDGHAAMGDGEVTLAALETSMDVDFSVELIKGDASAQVRAETKDYLIAFGVSGSVPDSIQIATSLLATWIKKDYQLTDSEVAILFASTLKYDITELVDSRFNIVAKVPKSILSAMK